MRPQSAFIPSQSYYKSKDFADDDLGRPVLQHKPLAKGEFTQQSLAKVFEDDPGMRPKVFAPAAVNKVSYGLMSFDIDGAVPQMKAAPNRARDTNPMAPQYVLPGSSALLAEAAAAASAAAPAPAPAPGPDGAPGPSGSSTGTATGRFLHPTHSGSGSSPQRPNTLDVSDINAVTSVSERPRKLETRGSQLTTADIDGSWPGWEPAFRAHVGRNLRDPGLDVRDISGPPSRRRAFSARPTVGHSRAAASSSTSGSVAGESFGREPTGQSASTSAQQPRQTYLPPQVSWQPVHGDLRSADDQQPPQQQQPAFAEASEPAAAAQFQQQQQQQQPPPQQPPQHAAGSWPTSITLPLRPTLAPPPFATHIPTGGPAVALAMAGSINASAVQRTAAAADHPSTTIGKPAPGRRDASMRHAAKRAVAEAQRAEAAEAQRVISSLRPSREAMEEFWASCRHLDREVCGKLTPADFAHALERSNLLGTVVSGAGPGGTAAGGQQQGGTASAAAAAAVLARGLQDGSGMVSYRYLARELLSRAPPQRRRASSAVRGSVPPPVPPPPPPPPPAAAQQHHQHHQHQQPPQQQYQGPQSQAQSAAQWPAPAPANASGTAARAAPAGGQETAPSQVIVGPAIRPSSRPMSRQTSRGNNGSEDGAEGGPSNGAPTGAAASAGGHGHGHVPHGVDGGSGDPSVAGPRRNVMWAPEPPVIIEGGPAPAPIGDIDGASASAPTTWGFQEQLHNHHNHHNHHHHHQQQRHHQQRLQLQQTGYPHHHSRPQSARSASKATVTAVFNLGASGASGTAAASAASAATSPQQPAASQPGAASAAAMLGMGFGPGWPPEPAAGTLQLRPTDAIMDTTHVELRDVVDIPKYFPYKAHAYWFGGRAPADAVGGPAEAAREYQPSTDPLSMLVGKGQHRIGFTPTGQKLEPEVEAAIVARLRPSSAMGTSPEATARAATAANVLRQLREDNPLLYPGAVDPTTPAGTALKSLLGVLYSPNTGSAATHHLGSTGGSGGGGGGGGGAGSSGKHRSSRGAVRPATAGSSRAASQQSPARPASVSRSISARVTGTLSGAGQMRVGAAALERQMQREEVAAVRSLY